MLSHRDSRLRPVRRYLLQMMAFVLALVAGLVSVLAGVRQANSAAEVQTQVEDTITAWNALEVSVIAGFMLLLAALAVHNANLFRLKTVKLQLELER